MSNFRVRFEIMKNGSVSKVISQVFSVDPKENLFLVYDNLHHRFLWLPMEKCELVEEFSWHGPWITGEVINCGQDQGHH